MSARGLVLVLAATAALAAVGCGEDQEDEGGSTTGATTGQAAAKPLKDVEPRAARPNIAGSDAPIEEFVEKAANDGVNYWRSVFEESQIPFREPRVSVLSEPADNGCGEQFEPIRSFYYVCAASGAGQISLSARLLRVLRSTSGDGEVAFLAGYAAAIDANDQLSGNPLAGGPDALTSKFHERAVCFTGAWIRNLAERQLLDAGDDQELARAAETFAPYGDVPRQMLQLGYDEGAAACQEQVQG